MPTRPSAREIFSKVRDGLAAVRAGHCSFAHEKHLSTDLIAFGLGSGDEYLRLIETLLVEIIQAGPVQSYAGGHPPQRSYEPLVRDEELWAYAWSSSSQGKRMYLKFVLKNAWYFHVDSHEENPK